MLGMRGWAEQADCRQLCIDMITMQDMMRPFGNVLHGVVLKDVNTYESRGFGFVHMDNNQSSAAAKAALDGKPHNGRPMIVKLRSERREVGGPGSGPRPPFMLVRSRLPCAAPPVNVRCIHRPRWGFRSRQQHMAAIPMYAAAARCGLIAAESQIQGQAAPARCALGLVSGAGGVHLYPQNQSQF